jgi:hypothetical protein
MSKHSIFAITKRMDNSEFDADSTSKIFREFQKTHIPLSSHWWVGFSHLAYRLFSVAADGANE